MTTSDRDTMKDVDHRPPDDLKTERVWERGRDGAAEGEVEAEGEPETESEADRD